MRPARWLLLVTLVGVLAILLWPSRPGAVEQTDLQLWLIRAYAAGLPGWIDFGLVEFCANVVMFVPIGALGALSRPPGGDRAVVGACLALSAIAELTQSLLLPERTGDLRDVLANTVGGLLGVLMVVLVRRRAIRRRNRVLLA